MSVSYSSYDCILLTFFQVSYSPTDILKPSLPLHSFLSCQCHMPLMFLSCPSPHAFPLSLTCHNVPCVSLLSPWSSVVQILEILKLICPDTDIMEVLAKLKPSKTKKSTQSEQPASKDDIINTMENYATDKSQVNRGTVHQHQFSQISSERFIMTASSCWIS